VAETLSLSTPLWIWHSDTAPASWHFLTIDGVAAEKIRAAVFIRRMEGGPRRGWGSIKVTATIGGTSWQTSILPAKVQNGWLLPIKADVRRAEKLVAGDVVKLVLKY
jgi:Domain of unknown function (DUF1905)